MEFKSTHIVQQFDLDSFAISNTIDTGFFIAKWPVFFSGFLGVFINLNHFLLFCGFSF